MDGRIAVGLPPPASSCRHGVPAHLGVEPDCQRTSALERFIVGWPVSGLVGWGCRSAHAAQLPRWMHEMNPSKDLCNRAGPKANISTIRTNCVRPRGALATVNLSLVTKLKEHLARSSNRWNPARQCLHWRKPCSMQRGTAGQSRSKMRRPPSNGKLPRLKSRSIHCYRRSSTRPMTL